MATRKIIEIDEDLCNGCGDCVPNCAEGAIQIVEGKAKLVADKYCDGLGACLGHCPEGALKVIERDADEFDEAAVEELLREQGRPPLSHAASESAPAAAPACPSARLQSFGGGPLTPCDEANLPRSGATGSSLTQWPVQITLVPPTAPFLKDADVLLAADCTPFAYADFHKDFMEGRKLLVGCPKLDDQQFYLKKFTEIFRDSGMKSLTIAVMEVPCCQMLPRIVDAAMKEAGKDIPVTVKVIGIKGELKQ
jgi:NAD-dependent dihydropyrimidine dehydrogenase PreA subunit